MNRLYEQDHAAVTPRPGSRLVVRIVAEMQLASGIDTIRVLEEQLGRRHTFDRAIFLLMILRESGRFRASSTGTASRASTRTDGISVNAVAMSLVRPFETVRRHVNALIADGLCERTARGVVVCDAALELPGFATLLRLLHDRMVRLIEDLLAFEVAMPVGHIERRYDPNATIAAAIDLVLAPFEYVGHRYDNWLELLVVNGVLIASARTFAFDPELGRRYGDADTVPPQELRAPVAVAVLARALRMSYSTVRREVEAGIASGKLMRAGRGVRATPEFLAGATIARGSQLAAERTAQVLHRLGPGGFRFDDPARCYLDGRPALLAFA